MWIFHINSYSRLYVSELHPEIVDWLNTQEIVWKLCHLSGQYCIVFSDQSEALRFKLKMGHWQETFRDPDYSIGSTNPYYHSNAKPVKVTLVESEEDLLKIFGQPKKRKLIENIFRCTTTRFR